MTFISGSRDCPFCGSDHKSKCFFIYEDGYHCFSCGSSKRADRNFSIQRLETVEGVELPEHTNNPSLFSLGLMKWLRQYHITDEMIRKYNILQAVDGSAIFPVVVDDSVAMYQQRWGCAQCGEMKCPCGLPRKIKTCGKKQPFIISEKNTTTLVLVEDFISTVRVGSSVDAYCMFGTSIPYEQAKALVKTYDHIVVWADGDAPGQSAASKLISMFKSIIKQVDRARSFAQSNKDVRNILTELDPKCYTNTEIVKIIQKAEVLL